MRSTMAHCKPVELGVSKRITHSTWSTGQKGTGENYVLQLDMAYHVAPCVEDMCANEGRYGRVRHVYSKCNNEKDRARSRQDLLIRCARCCAQYDIHVNKEEKQYQTLESSSNQRQTMQTLCRTNWFGGCLNQTIYTGSDPSETGRCSWPASACSKSQTQAGRLNRLGTLLNQIQLALN